MTWTTDGTDSGWSILNGKNERIATVWREAHNSPQIARLISASPELLAALLPLVEASTVSGGMIRFDGDELQAARAAIAKATGINL